MTTTTPLQSLAIIAGGGLFPVMVAENARARGINVFIVTLVGSGKKLDGFNSIEARPEQLGRIFAELRARNISDLVLIGRMARPRLFELRPDLLTLTLIPRIAYELCFGGDDALLKSVRRMLEQRGFRLHGAQEFVEGMAAPAGSFSKTNPDIHALDDIRVGIDAARALGRQDLGQAVIVRNGMIIGREDARGTDALIASCHGSGGILVKMAKPQQDRALDLPSIGPDTIGRCLHAGISGIAVEAGATLIANRQETIDMADAHGLFLIGVK